MQINLGCGQQALPGWVNVDRVALPGVDVAHDLDVAPWPWADGTAELVSAADVFEHVLDPLIFVNECWRILAVAGELHLRTTHWQTENAFTDPTHRRTCTEHSFDYWLPGTELFARHNAAYGGARFGLMVCEREGQELVFRLGKLA